MICRRGEKHGKKISVSLIPIVVGQEHQIGICIMSSGIFPLPIEYKVPSANCAQQCKADDKEGQQQRKVVRSLVLGIV